MKKVIQVLGMIFLVYSVLGIALHALANLENFGHYCENFLVPAGENHLQVYTAGAAIAAVVFLVAAKAKRRNRRKAV